MTRITFLIALRETPAGWHLTADGQIRWAWNCPVRAVYDTAGRDRLSEDDLQAIVWAADNHEKHDPALRAQVLAATVNR